MRLPVLLILSILTTSLFAQDSSLVSRVTVDRKFKDTFTFTSRWAYPEYTVKDDNGRFQITEDRTLTAHDTAHLFYTANCKTNVQGGYIIRYCYAIKDPNMIVLTFSDGLPAYASEFTVYIKGGDFWCEANTIYPVKNSGQKQTCTITSQALIVDKAQYSSGDTIKGFINMEFTESVTVPDKGIQNRKLFLRGYFKTPVQTLPVD